jgi:hypothetical protein
MDDMRLQGLLELHGGEIHGVYERDPFSPGLNVGRLSRKAAPTQGGVFFPPLGFGLVDFVIQACCVDGDKWVGDGRPHFLTTLVQDVLS